MYSYRWQWGEMTTKSRLWSPHFELKLINSGYYWQYNPVVKFSCLQVGSTEATDWVWWSKIKGYFTIFLDFIWTLILFHSCWTFQIMRKKKLATHLPGRPQLLGCHPNSTNFEKSFNYPCLFYFTSSYFSPISII